jgi:hypothetical protein
MFSMLLLIGDSCGCEWLMEENRISDLKFYPNSSIGNIIHISTIVIIFLVLERIHSLWYFIASLYECVFSSKILQT